MNFLTGRIRSWTIVSYIFILLCFTTGCPRQDGVPPTATVRPVTESHSSGETGDVEKRTPRLLFSQMTDLYKEAKTYADFGVVVVEYETADGKRMTDEIPLEIAVERPKLVRMRVADGTLVCNGKHLYACANHSSSLSLAAFGQVLEIAVPQPEISMSDLYPDPLLAEAMTLPFSREVLVIPPQLVLLFADDPVKTLLPDDCSAEWLEPKPLVEKTGHYDGVPFQSSFPAAMNTAADGEETKWCDRVWVSGPGGNRTYWIEQDTKVLRRIEFGTEGIAQEMKIHSIRAELRGAVLNPRLNRNDAFTMEEPRWAKHVPRFVPTEIDLPGTMPPNREAAAIVGPIGQPVSLQTLEGKVVVLLFWSAESSPCDEAIQEFQTLAKQWGTDARLRFYTVNTDSRETVSDVAVDTKLRQLGVTFPPFRPQNETLLSSLRCEALPTLVILAADGSVLYYVRGTKSAATIGAVLDTALSEKYSPTKLKAQFQRQYHQFRQVFDRFVQSSEFFQREQEWRPPILPVKLPQTIRLSQRWKTDEFKPPGNVYSVPVAANGKPQFLVVHDTGRLTFFDADGTVQKQSAPVVGNDTLSSSPVGVSTGTGMVEGTRPDIPPRFVRSVTSGGKTLIGLFAPFGRKLTLYDENLEKLGDVPLPLGPNDEICDVRFVMAAGVPQLCISGQRADGTGLLAMLSLTGEVLWQTNEVTMPAQIAVFHSTTDGGETTLFSMNLPNTEGTMKQFSATDGTFLRTIALPNDDLISWVATDSAADTDSMRMCIKITASDDDSVFLAGLSPDGTRTWEHPLFHWQLRQPVEPIVCADVTGDGFREWIVPTATGALMFLDKVGNLIDTFAVGEAISGVAADRFEGKTLLLVATPSGLTAWDVGVR